MRYGSVCSGIEAASVAWNPLGWEAAWFAEIEPFPSRVLKHHYPHIQNYGDMTALPGKILSCSIEAPDILCGGTPCQAFSVAGLRKSLEDARGNLSLTFCEIANAIDTIRLRDGKPESIVFWENVPGVLNTKDNAFGCFLGALAGEDVPLEPAGRKWTNAGCVFGPQRTVAWRVLDAQYFGVAQRRRRVFVVASARDGFRPEEILFEFDGVRRDTPPSREKGEKVAPTVTGGAPFSRTGNEFVECEPMVVATGQSGAEILFGISPTLNCNHEQPITAYGIQANIIGRQEHNGGNGFGFKEEQSPTLTVADRHAVAYPINTQIATRHKAMGERTGLGIGSETDPAFTLQEAHSHAIAFSAGNSAKARGIGYTEEGTPPLRAGVSGTNQVPTVAFHVDLLPTIVSNGDSHSGYRDESGLVTVASAVKNSESLYNKGITQGEGDASTQKRNTITLLSRVRGEIGAEAFAEWGFGILNSLQTQKILQQVLYGKELRQATFSRSWVVYCALSCEKDRSEGAVRSLREVGWEGCSSQGRESFKQLAGELGAYLSELSQPGAQEERFMQDMWEAAEGFGILREALSEVQKIRRPAYVEGESTLPCMQVRRLTPTCCEFLQGFPRGYLTQVPSASDSAMYKALGNSWAVPNVRWIGERINAAVEVSK